MGGVVRDHAVHPHANNPGKADPEVEVQAVTQSIELEVKHLDFFYNGDVHALKGISLPVYKNSVTALIGPSGCGKTTLLRCFNRMHDLYLGNRYEGEIIFQERNILSNGTDLISLRSSIGMVFQKPTPFPMTIFDNI